jgi:hypothetical protein
MVEELIVIEVDKVADEAAKGIIREGRDLQDRATQEFRKLVHTQRQVAHYTERASSAAFERPTQVRILASIHGPNLSIGSYHLSFQQARRGSAIMLRKTAKAAALH